MNPLLNPTEKTALHQAIAKENVLIVQNAAQQSPMRAHSLQHFCRLHFVFSQKEAIDMLREVADIRLVILDMNSLSADNYLLLKYLKLTGTYQGIPVINITPTSEDTERFTTLCFNISDFFLHELREEQFSSFVKDILVRKKKDNKDHNGVRTAYSTGKLLSPEEIKWMSDLEGLVGLHLSDTSYHIEKLAYDLHSSKSTLTRKIQTIYGINPGEYITRIRMEKALYYLESRQYVCIAQLASVVGFRHAGSFTRCFHNHFGIPPSDILR